MFAVQKFVGLFKSCLPKSCGDELKFESMHMADHNLARGSQRFGGARFSSSFADLSAGPAPTRQLKQNDSVCSIKSMGEDVTVVGHEGTVYLDTRQDLSQVPVFQSVKHIKLVAAQHGRHQVLVNTITNELDYPKQTNGEYWNLTF